MPIIPGIKEYRNFLATLKVPKVFMKMFSFINKNLLQIKEFGEFF